MDSDSMLRDGEQVSEPLLQMQAQEIRPVTPAGSESTQMPAPLELSRSTRYGILAGIWCANFLSSLNTTLVATLIPSISSEFKKSNQASWLGTAYLLATCTFTPLYGRLCNVMGRRGANQTAVFFAGLGVLCCGLSTNMEMLILARFLGGLGGGGCYTTSSIITTDMYSMRSRGLTSGIAAVFNGLGQGLGGPLGGVISEWLGWRWAFLLQMPLFAVSFALTSVNLHYTTSGKSKTTSEILKRIDYGGSAMLMATVLSFLTFLSTRYNDQQSWMSVSVIVPFVLAITFFITFLVWELRVAPEPILAPSLLKQRIPVLVGCSNFLVANCNFTIMYFLPMWFQTVMLTKASVAGLHLLPNSICMSIGSMFAGWMMHRTGKYKMINLIFGFCPFIGAVLISQLRETSNPVHQWLSIIPLGFGNAVVLQTMLIALLSHIPQSSIAVGTGFGSLFRTVGQVSGVGISSAIFQNKLDSELSRRIHGPDAAETIHNIRRSARLVASLEPNLQRAARDSYAVALKAVFAVAATSTLLAFVVRLPIPEKELEDSRPDAQTKHVADEERPVQAAYEPVPTQEGVFGVGDDGDSAGEEDHKLTTMMEKPLPQAHFRV